MSEKIKIQKTYNPSEVEDKIYKKWEDFGYFNPDNLDLPKDSQTYTIILPPPNITDKLHLGHSAMLAIEDLLIRYHRMKGFRTLWLPGTDHAAIATQNVVEKKLLKEEGLTRHDLGREKFLERVWDFLKQTQSKILHQTRKMGASLDWSREAFTFDKSRESAVKKMFIDMYNAGIIYRGERIVNWCPRCHSTLADDEVEYKAQKAKLYTFKYSKDFPFFISTTRPETKLGDTAVAVNPKDKRYQKYIGKIFNIDFCDIKLKLKVIADRGVEMDFGTGALGVTPAHSMVDWQIAQENNLDITKVIREDGKIKDGFFKYSGKTVEKAREMVVEKLKENGLLKKEEDIENNLSVCYRCGASIEPLPSKQWFVAVDKRVEHLKNKSLKEKAIEVAKNKEIRFIPERFEKRYLDWMENLHDWCISRQIWFGHRIPVWYKNEEIYVGEKIPQENGWVQDPDTLDTWFSSGMWTFSTLGWPETFKDGKKTGDLKKFHPTQVLETGYEIITLWVSRMIMMSLFAIGEIPFSNVYLHGMILDKHGKKMSKSKGNGIDPLDVIEKFGTDAVRLSILMGSTPGNDMRLSEEKIAGFRNFTNKLWNIARYILQNSKFNPPAGGQNSIRQLADKTQNLTSADKWILAEIDQLIKDVSKDINNYNFSQAGEKLRDFTWSYFADWYLEVSKFENNQEKSAILIYGLKTLLQLWHPFIPFVTEAIWQNVYKDKMLIVEKWPTPDVLTSQYDEKSLKEFNLIKNIITVIRTVRSENNIEPSKKVKAVIYAAKHKKLIQSQEYLIKNLKTGIKELEIKENPPAGGEKIKNAIYTTVSGFDIYLIGAIDFEKEKERITSEIEQVKKYISQIGKKLSNKEFVNNAPEAIVNKEKNKLESQKEKLEKLEVSLKNL